MLDQARSFYASSAGYTDIYNKVVSTLTGVADISTSTVSDADKIVAAVTAGKIATTATIETTSLQEQSLLGAMNLVLQAINTFADRFTQAIDGLGAITANIGNSQIALLGVVAKQTVPEHHWYDFAKGGTVGNYATGGMVGNGLYGVDSVLARYASGGTIGLAGGEYVMPADTTRLWKPQLDAMRTGVLPRQDNRRPAVNDNGQDMRELGRLIATGNAAIVNRLERVEAAFGAGTAAIATGARRVAEKKKMPGS